MRRRRSREPRSARRPRVADLSPGTERVAQWLYEYIAEWMQEFYPSGIDISPWDDLVDALKEPWYAKADEVIDVYLRMS